MKYTPLNKITKNDIRQLVDVLFSKETLINNLVIREDTISFEVAYKDPDNNEIQSDKLYLDAESIDSSSLYMDDKDQNVYGKWLLAKGVDARLIDNPFIEAKEK